MTTATDGADSGAATTAEAPPSAVLQQVKRLSGSTLTYGLGTVVGRLVGFLLLPLMTRYLAPSDYGTYSILALWSFLATSLFSLGLNPGVIGGWYYAEDPGSGGRDRVITTVLAVLASSAALVALLSLAAARPIASLALLGPEHAGLITLVLLTTMFGLLSMGPSMRLMLDQRASLFALLSGVSAIATAALTVALVVWAGRGVRGLVEAGLAGQALAFVLFFLPPSSRRLGRFDGRLALRVVRQAAPLIPATGLLLLLQHGNKYVMQWFGQAEQLGVYSIGFNFGMVIQLPLSAFQTAWYPYFASFVGRPDEAGAVFGRITTYYVLAFGCLSLLFYAAAKPLVLLMTQPAFHGAYLMVGLSSTAQLLLSIHVLLLPGSYFAREFGVQTALYGTGLAVMTLTSLLLIPTSGLAGAGVALVAGSACVLVVTAWWNWHRRHRYPKVQYEHARLARFAALYAGLAVIALRPAGGLGAEVLLSSCLVAAIGGAGFACLTASERGRLRAFLAGLFHPRRAETS